MYLKKSIFLVLTFLQIHQHLAYVLKFSEPQRSHLWNRQTNSDSNWHPSNFPSQNLQNKANWIWNSNRPHSTETEPAKVTGIGRSSDWTWNEDNTVPDTSQVAAKTLSFKVVDDHVHDKFGQPTWSHESVYDPYAFQNRNRHFLANDHQTRLHVHNHVNPITSATNTHHWQDLQPFTHFSSTGYRPPKILNTPVTTEVSLPPRMSAHGTTGNFLSSTDSASSYGTTGNGVIGHTGFGVPTTGVVGYDSSHAQSSATSFAVIHHAWDVPRQHSYHHPYYHHHPVYDHKRKRYQVEVHPGFIAAPIAGLAAFGVAHALSSKPVLFELGLVDKKKGVHHGHHHHSHGPPTYNGPPFIPKPGPISPLNHQHHFPPHEHHLHNHPHHQHFPSHFHQQQQHPTVVPHQDPPNHSHSSHHDEPIKYPVDKPSENSSNTSKPWWSPFAAMIPRLKR